MENKNRKTKRQNVKCFIVNQPIFQLFQVWPRPQPGTFGDIWSKSFIQVGCSYTVNPSNSVKALNVNGV